MIVQLHIEKFDGTNATAMIRWCLAPEEIEKIKDLIWAPQVIISVLALQPSGQFHFEENRITRPITDMATYISFRNPGKHLIVIGILKRDKRQILEISRRGSGYNVYKHAILDYGQKFLALHEYVILDDIQASLEVEVDERLFAPKPWDYQLVNYWFDTKPIDQCHLRKRRFLAYFLTFVLMPLLWLYTLLIDGLLISGLIGCSGLNWRWLINPFNNERISDEKHCLRWLQYPNLQRKPLWRILTNWRFLTIAGGLIWLLLLLVTYKALIATIAAILILSSIIGLTAHFHLFDNCSEWIIDWVDKFYYWRKQRQYKSYRLRVEKSKLGINKLDCKLVPKNVGFDTLPDDRKTVYLRFLNLKKKMCRPFAGN